LDDRGGRFVLKRELVESRRLKKRVGALHADAEVVAISRAAAEAFCAAAGQQGAIKYLAPGAGILRRVAVLH